MSIKLGDAEVAGLQDISGKANTSLNNLTSAGANIANWSHNVTNCTTEIPQDVKVEINNGKIVLKAGSKVYVPNGVGVFDEHLIENDITMSAAGAAGSKFVFVNTNENGLFGIVTSNCLSDTTGPTVTNVYQVWYDTVANKIYTAFNKDNNWVWTHKPSFPICIYTSDGTNVTSIDKVFNGLTYVGTSWAMFPGVKGLVPNGLNDDGSYKSIEFTNPSVYVYTYATAGRQRMMGVRLNQNGNIIDVENNIAEQISSGTKKGMPAEVSNTLYHFYYATDENQWYSTTGSTTANWEKDYPFFVGRRQDNGTTTSEFRIFNTFRADDADLVHTGNDEYIDGIKTFLQPIKRISPENSNYTSILTAIKKGIPNNYTASNKYVQTNELRAEDGTFLAWGTQGVDDIGNTVYSINVRNRANSTGSNRNASLGVVLTSAGVGYGTAPASDAKGSIVTTANKNKNTSGYYYLGNGLMIQWGTLETTGTDSRSLTYPTKFSSANSYSITANPKDASTTALYTISINSKSATGCTIYSGGNVRNFAVLWIAIGY